MGKCRVKVKKAYGWPWRSESGEAGKEEREKVLGRGARQRGEEELGAEKGRRDTGGRDAADGGGSEEIERGAQATVVSSPLFPRSRELRPSSPVLLLALAAILDLYPQIRCSLATHNAQKVSFAS